MSGHSKWSQIKRQKGATDVKRGATFSKLSNAIIITAKSGGDPNSNFSLKMAVEKARTENMPKENIDRAIKRGTGEIAGEKIEEVLYEAIGPGNISIILETVTDNKNRTLSELKNSLTKFGGKLTGSGSATYHFKKMGKICLGLRDENREELELQAIDAGVIDFEEQDDVLAVFINPQELESTKGTFEQKGLEIREANLSWEPINLVKIEDHDLGQKIIELMTALENLEDVSGLYSNFDIPKEIT